MTLPECDIPEPPATPTATTVNLFAEHFDQDADSSLAVENGTSFTSSRNGLNEFFPDDDDGVGSQTTAHEFEADDNEVADDDEYEASKDECDEPFGLSIDLTNIDPNLPVICETINDFCARHSKEELEFLVKQVGCLRISDCYFSERSSTVCMAIQVLER